MTPVQRDLPEEVDILSFLKPIGSLFTGLYRFLNGQLKKIRKNAFLFFVIILAVALIGFLLRFVLPKQYQLKAIFITHELPAEVCSLQLNSLNQLISKDKKSTTFADKLQISKDIAAQVVSIRSAVKEDIKFKNETDSTTNRIFEITVGLNSPAYIDSIQNGVQRFLENNDYSVKRKEAKRAALYSLKANLLKKAQSLDSLKTIVNSSIVPRSLGQGIILGEPVNPVSVYQAEIAYYKEQLEIDENLAIIENIEVIQPFLKISAPNYPNYNKIVLYFLLGGAIFSFIYISLRGKK